MTRPAAREANCPCCGAPMRAGRLRVELDYNVVAYGERSWRVTAQLAEFLYALNEAWPRTVGYEAMCRAVWGAFGGPDHGRRVLRVYVWQARQILRAIGADIEVIRGRGLRLAPPPASRAGSIGALPDGRARGLDDRLRGCAA